MDTDQITPEEWAARVAALDLPQWNAIIGIASDGRRYYHVLAWVVRQSFSGCGPTPDEALAAILRERDRVAQRCPTCGRADCAPVQP